jgi:hypothetical protein
MYKFRLHQKSNQPERKCMLRERIAGGGVRPLSARVAPCSHNSSIIIRAVLFKRPRKLPFCVRQHGAGGFINRRIKNDRCRAAFFLLARISAAAAARYTWWWRQRRDSADSKTVSACRSKQKLLLRAPPCFLFCGYFCSLRAHRSGSKVL